MFRCIMFAVFVIVGSVAFAEDTYLCVGEVTVGMIFNSSTNTWSPIAFNNGNKYIFRRTKPEDKAPWPPQDRSWALFSIGDDYAVSNCKFDFNKPDTSSVFESCDGVYHFEFNRRTLRFQLYAKGEYMAEHPLGPTPAPSSLEIGKCSAL